MVRPRRVPWNRGQSKNGDLGKLTRDEMDYLTGSLLGDGHLALIKGGLSAHYTEPKKVVHRIYLDFKANLLSRLGGEVKGTKESTQFRYVSKCWPELLELRNLFYPGGGIKRVPRHLVNGYLTEKGLSLWFQDDGSFPRMRSDLGRRLVLCTNCFPLSDQKFLRSWFTRKWGITPAIIAIGGGKSFRLHFTGENKDRLINLISPLIHPVMGYKTGNSRPSRDLILMETAYSFSKRSTCKRAQVGAVLSIDGRIICTGYAGSLPGEPHCLDVGCLIGPEGGCTRTQHAEAGLLKYAEQRGVDVRGSTIHCTLSPCLSCAEKLRDAGIKRVVYSRLYRKTEGIDLLKKAGVSIEPLWEMR